MGASVEVAPGGDGLVISKGRVRQARKVPLRPVLAWVAAGGMLLAAVAGLVCWVAATLAPRWDVLGSVARVSFDVASFALILAVFAGAVLVLVLLVPYETWALYGTGANRFERKAARRLARRWPRKSGQVMDAIRGDDGRFYRPSLRSVAWTNGRLVLVLVLPRVLKGSDLDPYFSRLESLGPDVFGLHELRVKLVDAGYWATVAHVEITHSDCSATSRSVLDRLRGVS